MSLGLLVVMPFAVRVAFGSPSVHFEPVVGYERAFKATPTPHTNLRFLYGFRAVAGYSLLSGELEATRAGDSESYPADAKIIDETSDKLKVGLRTSATGPYGSAFFRVGGQAQRLSRTTTISSVATKTQDPISVRPYAGVGAELGGRTFRMTGAATMVFRDTSDWQQNEVETTLGFKFGL